MKTLLHPRSAILAFILLLAVAGFSAFGQDTNAVAPADATGHVSTGLADTIADFAVTHPWMVGLLSLIGALRLCIKPLMTAARYYVHSTETDADDVFLDKIEHSFLYTAFLFALDWLTSIKLKTKSPDEPLNRALRAILFILLPSAFILGGVGCAPLDPAGVYRGDQLLHKSELVTTTSYEVIHTYVTWEKDNRPALAAYPEIKQSADVMRANARQWFATANALHDAYAANPTSDNGAALTTALAVLQTALNEAVKYMSQAAAIKSE